MSHNMLGIAPQTVCGPMIDLLQKISGPTANAWLEELAKFLRKEKTWSRIIRIDRSKPFASTIKVLDIGDCKPWLEAAKILNRDVELLHPEYENSGPEELDMDKIRLWGWDDVLPGEEAHCNRLYMQKSSPEGKWVVSLEGVYKYLCVGAGYPVHQLGIRDAQVMTQYLEYIPNILKNTKIHLWKSLAKSAVTGKVYVPHLCVFSSRTAQRPYVIGWSQVTDVSLSVKDTKNLIVSYS